MHPSTRESGQWKVQSGLTYVFAADLEVIDIVTGRAVLERRKKLKDTD